MPNAGKSYAAPSGAEWRTAEEHVGICPSVGDNSPKGVFLHAALLRQAFAHCGKFLTAASRRSLGRVSVPVWLSVLTDQLPVIGLVGHYPTNDLMGRGPLSLRVTAFLACASVCGISTAFAVLSPTRRHVPT